MASKPIIFFVHGAWHQSAHFAGIRAKLEEAGYTTECPTQPSFNVPRAHMKDFPMTTDAHFIRGALEKLVVDEQRDVLVVLHSYGGVVGTQAIDASLSIKARAAKGLKGGITRLVFMCAFMLPPNSSLGDAFGGELPPFIKAEPDGSCSMIDPRIMFYKQLDDETAAKWLELCKPHPASAQLSRLSYCAWMEPSHSRTYIICSEDPALPPDAQRGMVQACRDNGLEIDVHEIAADHSPYLGKESELIAILDQVAATA